MEQNLNRRTLGPLDVAGGSLLLALALGCVPFGPPPDVPLPPADVEGCSDDHDGHWEPSPGVLHVAVWFESAEPVPASDACNTMPWHTLSGGGQGGDVVHFEPIVVVEDTDGWRLEEGATVTWTIYNLETGTQLEEQSFEAWDVEPISGGQAFRAEVLIGSELRGRNLIVEVQADLTRDVEGGTGSGSTETVTESARAAVLLDREVPL